MNNIKNCFFRVFFLFLIFLISCTSVDISNPSDNQQNTNYSAKESFSYEFTVDNRDQIYIDANNSTINLVGEKNISKVKVWGERIVKSESESDAVSHLELLKVTVDSTIENIYIQTKQPDESNGREYLVNYNLSVPKNWNVTVEIINGVVSIDSLNGEINLNMVNGDINLNDIEGNIDINLTNGEVYNKMSLPENGVCEIIAVNAKIELQIPQSTSANFAAGVLNGTVSVTKLKLQNIQSANNFVNGLLGDGKGTIKLEAINGVINASGF